MPYQPKEEEERARHGQIFADGKRYEATTEGEGYVLWALVNKTFNAFQASDPDAYLDDCANLVWEALLKPAHRAAMTYVKELPAKPLAGREYSVVAGDLAGTIHIYIAQTRIFVLMAVNSPKGQWERARFLGSFAVLPNLPMERVNYGDPGFGVTSTANEDNRVLQGSEVTQKTRVLNKPEPVYPESARKYGIRGNRSSTRGLFKRWQSDKSLRNQKASTWLDSGSDAGGARNNILTGDERRTTCFAIPGTSV